MRAAIAFIALAACSVPDKFLVTGDGPDGDADMVAPGTFRWIRSMSAMSTFGVAAGAGGNVLVVGDLGVPADLGGGLMTPNAGVDMVIAAFAEADAAHVYSVRHGNAANEFPFMDVGDATGSPIVYGLTGGSPYDVGQGSTVTAGQSDGYIGRYGAGAPAWVNRLAGPLDDKFIASARGAGSTVWGVGWFEGNASWGVPPVVTTVAAKAGRDIFVSRMNTFTGAIEVTKPFGTMNREEGSGAAPVAGGGVIVAGMFDNLIDPTDRLFGGGSGGIMGGLGNNGGLDVYVAKLDVAGSVVWAKNYGGIGDDRDPRVATDAAGDIYIVASFRDKITLGMTAYQAKGLADVFVAKLRGDDGSVVWSTTWGGDGDDGQRGISVDGRGNVVVTGWAVGALDGGTTLGAADAVIASYNAADGTQRWRKVFSTAGDDRAWTSAFGANGDVYASVNMGGAYDFGFPITGPAAPSSVVMRIAP